MSRYEDEPDFIYQIVTQDETLVHHFDPESIETEHAVDVSLRTSQKKFKRVPSAGKMMGSFFLELSRDNHN
jgi:hypothetical protein